MATKTFKIGLSNTDKQNMAQDVYERVLDLTFAEYDSTKTYNTGDFVVYDNVLYKCKEDNVTGTWDSSKWQTATLQDLLDDVEGAVASVSGKANTIDLQNGTLVPAKSLVAEQIENVSEDSGTVQDNPFTFQATATDGGAGASDTAPTAKYLKLKGQTYAFNQLVRGMIPTRTNVNGLTFTNNGDGSLTITGTATANFSSYDVILSTQVLSGHTYLGKLTASDNNSHNYFRTNRTSLLNGIGNVVSGGSIYITFNCSSGDEINVKVSYQLFDLTQTFNGDIPDAILNGVELEDYNLTFTGVDIFNQLFPLPYYANNAGSLVSANATKLTTYGKNQCNGIFEAGTLLNGEDYASTTSKRTPSSQIIKVIPKQLYQFNRDVSGNAYIFEYDGNKNFIQRDDFTGTSGTKKLQANCHYVRLVVINEVSKVDFSIYWDGTRTGYEEYVKHEYSLGSELEEHPLLSAGNVCDEKTPDGTITRRIGVVDLGSLTWYAGSNNRFSCYVSGITNFKTPSANNVKANILCAKYITYTDDDFSVNLQDKSISCPNGSGAMITIRDTNSAYTDAATFKAAMNGVYVYYELATPTEEQGDSFPEVIEVDDFGTMEYGGTNYNGYPQGCEFFYPADYVLFIDTLGNSVDWEAGNIATKNDLKYHELDSANIGEITTTTITTGFYKNSIAITSGLSTAIDVRVQMSNGAIYPAILNGATELVIFNGTNFQTAGTTVVKVYWKN